MTMRISLRIGRAVRCVSCVVIALLCLAASSRPANGDFYTVTDLGTIGGNESAALGINAANQVCGNAEASDGNNHAFRFDGTSMIDLGTLNGGLYSGAEAINDAGDIVGTTHVP